MERYKQGGMGICGDRGCVPAQPEQYFGKRMDLQVSAYLGGAGYSLDSVPDLLVIPEPVSTVVTPRS